MTRRHAWTLSLLVIGSLALAGCSAGTATTPTTSSSTSTIPTTVPPGTASLPIIVAPIPTLGQLTGVFSKGKGFGKVRPSEIYNGGDPTGLVQHVVWRSWGGSRAVGTGDSDYVAPGQTVAQGRDELATVVAFDLAKCEGKLMYRAIEWYFPQHGQSFNSKQYENICTGSYVTS